MIAWRHRPHWRRFPALRRSIVNPNRRLLGCQTLSVRRYETSFAVISRFSIHPLASKFSMSFSPAGAALAFTHPPARRCCMNWRSRWLGTSIRRARLRRPTGRKGNAKLVPVNVDALGKSYHRIRREQIRINFRRDKTLSPCQRPVRLLCNGVAFARFGRPCGACALGIERPAAGHVP